MNRAFTLIELLIVVAIIAILAAIAVPNFLEAQVRAKVSRMKTDMRSIATGLESYYVDNNKYPYGNPGSIVVPRYGLALLSTPIAYLTNPLVPDVFLPPNATQIQSGSGTWFSANAYNKAVEYSLRGRSDTGAVDVGISGLVAGQQGRWWILKSNGPDQDADGYSMPIANNQVEDVCNILYDPTNGTVSNGNIFRAGGAAEKTAGRLVLSYSGR